MVEGGAELLLTSTSLSRKNKKNFKKKQHRKDRRQHLAEEQKVEDELLVQDPNHKAKIEHEERVLLELKEQEKVMHEIQRKQWEEKEHQLQLQLQQQAEEEERRKVEEAERAKLAAEEKEKRAQAAVEARLAQNGAWKNEDNPKKNGPRPTVDAEPAGPDKTWGTEKDSINCSFFLKTGVCRYGDRCGKSHIYPPIGNVIVFQNMYDGVGMSEVLDEDGDDDLQYDEAEIVKHYREFYFDVHDEFKKFGPLLNFKVCRNFAPHLRGNVYVHYKDPQHAADARAAFNGRFYAGKQLICEFAPLSKWKPAICGLFDRQQCPRGKDCNFLHVFRNPYGEYAEADRDFLPIAPRGRLGEHVRDHIGGRDYTERAHSERDKEETHTDRDRDRDRDRDKDRGRDRERRRDRDRDRDGDRDGDRGRGRDGDRRVRDRDGDRGRDRDGDRGRGRDRDRDRDRHKDRDREMDKDYDKVRRDKDRGQKDRTHDKSSEHDKGSNRENGEDAAGNFNRHSESISNSDIDYDRGEKRKHRERSRSRSRDRKTKKFEEVKMEQSSAINTEGTAQQFHVYANNAEGQTDN